jgi:hypothetical protein
MPFNRTFEYINNQVLPTLHFTSHTLSPSTVVLKNVVYTRFLSRYPRQFSRTRISSCCTYIRKRRPRSRSLRSDLRKRSLHRVWRRLHCQPLPLRFPISRRSMALSRYHSSLTILIPVHQYAVTGNNCSTAGAPFALSNETNIPFPCPTSDVPNDCRAGDMSGQFGNLTSSSSSMTASYYDPYISLDPTAANYIGNLSFNVHFANFSVIACAK